MGQQSENQDRKCCKIGRIYQTCDQCPSKFNFGHFFSSIILPRSAKEKQIFKNCCSGKMGNFLLLWLAMIRVLLRGMSKNEQIQFFVSQMFFPVILTSWIWNLSAAMVGYTGLRKNSRNSREINPLRVYRNVRVCIRKVNSEGHLVGSDLRVNAFFEKDGAAEDGGVNFVIGDISTSAHLYWMLEKISCRAFLLSCFVFLITKIAFKSSLALYFRPSIIEFRIGEKTHTKTIVDVSKGAGGRVPGRLGGV